MLEGSISVGHFHDSWTGRRRGEVDLRKVPVVLLDAEREFGAPGLASTLITTRLRLSWNTGDLVEDSCVHRR